MQHNFVLGLKVGEPGLAATGRGLMELLKPVKSQNIGINHKLRYGKHSMARIEPETGLPTTLERLVHMHVKDEVGGKDKENFPALGDGEIDFTKVDDIVKKSAFKGPFTVEIENRSETPAQRDDGVKLENYLTMVTTGRRFGSYPLLDTV